MERFVSDDRPPLDRMGRRGFGGVGGTLDRTGWLGLRTTRFSTTLLDRVTVRIATGPSDFRYGLGYSCYFCLRGRSRFARRG